MGSLFVQQIDINTTTDQELVQLAGLYAYLERRTGERIRLNTSTFRIVDTNYNHPTGLDALTLQNVNTGEFIMAFVGTNVHAEHGMQDLKTNVRLLNEPTPPQLRAANEYYLQMQAELAKSGHSISYVCGNSLGGALANSVAVKNPEVKSVTINPALLPSGLVVKDAEYPNITNYISQYDILNLSIRAGQLDHRVPGNQYDIYHGIPSLEALGPNHTGYVRQNGQHVPYYESGEPGTIDYVKIYMDAHEHIVTSIWTGEPLYGGRSIPIRIDREHLLKLGDGLETKVIERLKRTQTYINSSVAIVEAEGADIDKRLNTLRTVFQEMIRRETNQVLNEKNRRLKEMVAALHTFLNLLETRCRSLNYVLNSPPMELFEFLARKDISVESICQEIRNKLYELEDMVDRLTDGLHNITMDRLAEVLQGGQNKFYDYVVGELKSHLYIVQQNQERAITQMSEYQSQVVATGEKFHLLDLSLSQRKSISSALNLSDVLKTSAVQMEESPYLMMHMRIKKVAVDAATATFKQSTNPIISGITSSLDFILRSIEFLGNSARFSINTATNLALYGNVPGLAISLFSDYNTRVKNAVNNALYPLDDLLETIKGIRNGLSALRDNYLRLVDELRPYIDSAIFSKQRFQNVTLYNTAACSILKEMELLFNDIVYQLSHNQGKAIKALQLTGNSVRQNMSKLEEQLERGTLYG
ncbi:SA1320 family protein [Alkalihalobacterium sp. APHAB7]|uniref:SA1320 family protein n=1 Tax=Alkalihalobacterium sp. APHAB7 TaxID=3402081 RepID=UPI003AAAED6B